MNNCTRKILLVEDDKGDTKMIERILNEVAPNTKVISRTSMKQAYDTFKSHELDLVILDLNLPDGYGPASVKEMRRFNRSTPILVLTGLASDITVNEALKNGANQIILKSKIKEDEFKRILSEHLKDNWFLD